MIRLYSVCKAYQPGQNILDSLTLRIKEGEFAFLTGVSGAGKSTLLKLIFGAEKVTGGQVLIHGRHLGTYWPETTSAAAGNRRGLPGLQTDSQP